MTVGFCFLLHGVWIVFTICYETKHTHTDGGRLKVVCRTTTVLCLRVVFNNMGHRVLCVDGFLMFSWLRKAGTSMGHWELTNFRVLFDVLFAFSIAVTTQTAWSQTKECHFYHWSEFCCTCLRYCALFPKWKHCCRTGRVFTNSRTICQISVKLGMQIIQFYFTVALKCLNFGISSKYL